MLERDFGGAAGWVRGPTLAGEEVVHLRALIWASVQHVVRELWPLEAYHRFVSDGIHRVALSKPNRILGPEATRLLERSAFWRELVAIFGPSLHLADEESVGHGQITFRIVRPWQEEDLGSVHADKWFWAANETALTSGIGRVKCWIPLSPDQELSGLLLATGSHLEDRAFAWSKEDRTVFAADSPDRFDLFAGEVGESVLFNYGLLHVGALNKSGHARISVEMTLLFEET